MGERRELVNLLSHLVSSASGFMETRKPYQWSLWEKVLENVVVDGCIDYVKDVMSGCAPKIGLMDHRGHFS